MRKGVFEKDDLHLTVHFHDLTDRIPYFLYIVGKSVNLPVEAHGTVEKVKEVDFVAWRQFLFEHQFRYAFNLPVEVLLIFTSH
jgi:hypothetical protein